jgi:aminopeptidase N
MLPHNANLVKKYADEMMKIFKIEKKIYGASHFDKFGMLEIPTNIDTGFAACSGQGLTFVHERCNTEFVNTQLFAHEIGHYWWGNYIHFQKDIEYFTETLTSYGICIVMERLYGWDKMIEWMKHGTLYAPNNTRKYLAEAYKQAYLPLDKQTTFDDSLKKSSKSDNKDFWLFHVLRGAIGDKAFFDALKNLAMGKYGRNIGNEEFKKAFKDSSKYDIDRFWAEWFDRSGVPEYAMNYKIYPKNREYEVKGVVEQLGDLYTTPVEIGIKTKNYMLELLAKMSTALNY